MICFITPSGPGRLRSSGGGDARAGSAMRKSASGGVRRWLTCMNGPGRGAHRNSTPRQYSSRGHVNSCFHSITPPFRKSTITTCSPEPPLLHAPPPQLQPHSGALRVSCPPTSDIGTSPVPRDARQQVIERGPCAVCKFVAADKFPNAGCYHERGR